MPDPDKKNDDTNVEPEDKADESQAGDEGAEGQKEEAKKPEAAEAKAPEPTADDKAWTELRARGYSAEQITALASEGYDAREVAKKAKADDAAAEKSKAAEDDGEYEPVSRAEYQKALKEQKEELKREMQMTSQAAINHATIEAALNSSPANDNPQAREILSAMVYKKMATGEALPSAIKTSLDEYKGFISGQSKAFFRKKVAATAATGGIPAGEPVLAKMPELKHAVTDFQDGKATEQAMERVRALQQP